MYTTFNDNESSPLSGDNKQGLRKRTKIIIVFFIVVILAAVVTTVTIISVKDEKDKKEEKKCTLNEVKDNPPAPHPERVLLRYVSLPPTSPSTNVAYAISFFLSLFFCSFFFLSFFFFNFDIFVNF